MGEIVLEARELSIEFGALKAVDGVSLDLKEGEIHALIGPNGAGKSTFLKLLAGDLRPGAGHVTLMGRDVTGLGAAERAREGLAQTFQISQLALEHSARENVLLALVGAERRSFSLFGDVRRDGALVRRADRALDRVALLDEVGRAAGDLSHGGRRRLEIAIALALAPRALLMDEPLAGLGPDGSAQMTGLLDALRHQTPILLIEHDMDAVFRLADRISVLDYGRLLATGAVDEIRANPDVRAAYLGGVA